MNIGREWKEFRGQFGGSSVVHKDFLFNTCLSMLMWLINTIKIWNIKILLFKNLRTCTLYDLLQKLNFRDNYQSYK